MDYATIVVLVVVAVIVALLIILTMTPGSTFGTWEVSKQPCTSGTRTVIRTCIPNGSVGCMDEDGKQTLLRQVSTEPCKPSLVRSEWLETGRASCTTGVPDDMCVNMGTIGSRAITVECIPRDTAGSNGCINVELTDVRGPNGEMSQSKSAVQYSIGDVVTYTDQCSDYLNPIC